jgi:small subunit ribosomal protein S2
VDLPIPGNDDSIRSIELIVKQLADAILEGKTNTTADIERQKSDGGDK